MKYSTVRHSSIHYITIQYKVLNDAGVLLFFVLGHGIFGAHRMVVKVRRTNATSSKTEHLWIQDVEQVGTSYQRSRLSHKGRTRYRVLLSAAAILFLVNIGL